MNAVARQAEWVSKKVLVLSKTYRGILSENREFQREGEPGIWVIH
jgi:hypothetical protein